MEHPETYSIDFTEGTCPSGDIVYRIKANQNSIYQNCRQNGSWMLEDIPDDNYLAQEDENEFTVTFHFTEEEIYIYSGDESRNLEYNFQSPLSMYSIGCVHVWDDVDRVKEITFRYAD